MDIKKRRSALYLPCSKPRVLEKSLSVPADVLLYDLEDAVDPSQKEEARDNLVNFFQRCGPINKEVVVRINGLDTPWGYDDLVALKDLSIDGLCLPKAESVEAINEALAVIAKEVPVWLNIETPKGVLQVEQLASEETVHVILMGTNDLSKCMRMLPPVDDSAFHYAFSRCIMAARAYDCDILDGVYNAFKDVDGFTFACTSGKALGFDGKTLIHPDQIAPANQIFSPSSDELAQAKAIVEAWNNRDATQGIAVLNGAIIEQLHVDHAHRLIQLASE
ncbi:MAG: CoA ester lyase [Cellvibrionales bacterium]|nr:CoA ester lyase [Cellvibrionales bacterium]